MNESERQQLAKRLTAMTWKQVRREIKQLDRDANMKFFRNSYWDEFQTLYLLPNEGLQITLVEKVDRDGGEGPYYGAMMMLKKRQKVQYRYVEARVEEIDRPVGNAGGRGRSPRTARA